jgi:hypothetical protein
VYSELLFVGLYSEPIISGFFKFLHEKSAGRFPGVSLKVYQVA